jgi:hypothetical protein
MPAGNKMGPEGVGPMTGRKVGYCAGYTQPGFRSAGFGYGRMSMIGRGRFHYDPYGRGSFFGHPWEKGGHFAADEFEPQPVSLDEEEHILSQQASRLKSQLDLINAHLEKLQAKKTTEG